ncbi:hypothetical protein BSU00_09975 [Tenacibaculum sp. SG-28]|nr:hypothetical protein BSU00_09975 [Tenacibaculum sp. SG-28]
MYKSIPKQLPIYTFFHSVFNFFIGILFLCFSTACTKNTEEVPEDLADTDAFIRAVDISSYPEIAATGVPFYDRSGNQKEVLQILNEHGVNTIRLRLWVHPKNAHSGFDEVREFSKFVKSRGFKTWLSVHYSDTWADPGQQETPASWNQGSFEQVKDSVRLYTQKIVTALHPDYMQIGNEINSGFLHPYGHISAQYSQFIALMNAATAVVRENSSTTKIIVHYAGVEGASWFFEKVRSIDYDIIGLSYYPIWHGKSTLALQTEMQNLSSSFEKKIVVAETAYPFTLDWNDWTTNIVGLEDQLILPVYPATPNGQKNFIRQIKTITKNTDNGLGFCYWGGELVAWKGEQARDASPWENQALFDFNSKALPVLEVFNEE